MLLAIYVKDQFYKSIDVPTEKYNLSEMLKLVHKDLALGLIPNVSPEDKIKIHFSPVK
jgi:hypothetical protein